MCLDQRGAECELSVASFLSQALYFGGKISRARAVCVCTCMCVCLCVCVRVRVCDACTAPPSTFAAKRGVAIRTKDFSPLGKLNKTRPRQSIYTYGRQA